MEKTSSEKTLPEEKTPKRGGGKVLLIVIVLIVLVLAGLWWFGKLPVGALRVASDSYQAVFLTNNQVYFGKLANANSQFPVLRDIFYLQVTQALQPADQTAPAQQISLVKLGGELHGPEDEMAVNRDHILFYEDLKDDSQIVQRIKEFKAQQK